MRPSIPFLASTIGFLLVASAPAISVAQAAPTPSKAMSSFAPTSRQVTTVPSVTFAFGGDTHFERDLASYAKPSSTALRALTSLMGSADVAMVNLETAVTTRGTAQPKKYTFRANPSALSALSRAGVDVVTMANNHGADFGSVGLSDTLKARAAAKSSLGVVGIGRNISDAFSPWVTNVRGQRVAVFGATSISDWTTSKFSSGASKPGVASAVSSSGLSRLVAAVRYEHAKGSIVVVYLHWGMESEQVPNGHQRAIAAALVRAGAQIVVGSHAHMLQGAGRSGASVVAYGMGNFVWYNHKSSLTSNSGVLRVTVTGGKVSSSSFAPTHTAASGLPVADSSSLTHSELARLAGLARKAGLSPLR